MAKGKNIFRKEAKRPGGGRHPFLLLLLVALLIVGIFFALETIRARKSAIVEPIPPQGRIQPTLEQPVGVPVPPAEEKILPPPKEPGLLPKRGEARLAIIVDDMGSSVAEAEKLNRIGVTLTYSIIPGLPKSRQVADYASKSSIPVMIHLPMEPKGYPVQRLEKNGLLLAQTDEEIMRRVNGYFQAVPFAIGANNHMGSRFTEDKVKMATVLQVLKDKGAFFVDSRTSGKSVGYSLAREMGIKTGSRDVFLDNVQEVAYIKGQLDQAVAVARKHGSAIAICHPHPVTMKALAALLPVLQAEGVQFVPVSQVIN